MTKNSLVNIITEEEFKNLRDADVYYKYLVSNQSYPYKQIAVDFICFCADGPIIKKWLKSQENLQLTQEQVWQLEGALEYIENGYHENIGAHTARVYEFSSNEN